MGTFKQFIEIIVVWLIIGEESHDTTSLYIYNPHKIFITFSNLCPNLRCVKQNLLLQFSFSIRLQLALKIHLQTVGESRNKRLLNMWVCATTTHSPIRSIEWQEGCSSPADLFTLHLGFTDLGLKSITCYCATRPLLSPKQDLIGSYPIHWPKKVQIPQDETHLSRHEHSSKLQNLRNAQEDSKKKKLR